MLLRWVLFMAIFAFGVGVLVSYAGLVFGWGRSLPLVTGSSRRSIEVAAGLYGIWILTRPLLVAASRVRSPASSIAELLEPGASVVIPCSNAAGQLDETVRTILAQTYRPLEIILVENNSADDTWNVCQRLEREHPGIVRAARVDVHAWEYACSVAVNVGVRVARYEGIIRMDCDTIMAETMIEKAMLELRRPGTSAVAVNLRISNPTSSLITRLQSIEYLLAMELDRRFQGMFDSVVCCSGGLSAYRRSTILSSGGFCSAPKWVSEDLDMTMKAHRLGYVRTAPSAIGYTGAGTLGEHGNRRLLPAPPWLGPTFVLVRRQGRLLRASVPWNHQSARRDGVYFARCRAPDGDARKLEVDRRVRRRSDAWNAGPVAVLGTDGRDEARAPVYLGHPSVCLFLWAPGVSRPLRRGMAWRRRHPPP